jgi:ATP-dependent RNA helicase DDX52/ROK1
MQLQWQLMVAERSPFRKLRLRLGSFKILPHFTALAFCIQLHQRTFYKFFTHIHMDPLRLLSRSTKQTRSSKPHAPQDLPSSGKHGQPQLFSDSSDIFTPLQNPRKRKRNDRLTVVVPQEQSLSVGRIPSISSQQQPKHDSPDLDGSHGIVDEPEKGASGRSYLPLADRKTILKRHKLKVTWLNRPAPTKGGKRKRSLSGPAAKSSPSIYPRPLESFNELTTVYSVSKRLVENISQQGLSQTTEVQLGGLPLLLEDPKAFLNEAAEPDAGAESPVQGVDLLTVAPTGSGKTFAFLIPLVHRLRHDKKTDGNAERRTGALILAPTRELASQIVNEGRKLVKNVGLSISQMKKGMQLYSGTALHGSNTQPVSTDPTFNTIVKSDIVVATPGVLQSALRIDDSSNALASVRYLILDEADVLLDPLFREQTLDIWNGLSNPALRVSLWSATMGSNIEELTKSTIDQRRLRVSEASGIDIPPAPLLRLVVGLKDSAVPNVEHKLVYAASEQGKLMGLRQLLHPAASSAESGTPLRPPFLVFTQTVERAIALHAELLYDIPVEAGGIDRIAVLHSDLTETARENVMTRFRKGEIWVLITTDLLSRGVDFLGVNGVVNYDLPTSSASYVHRIGRTGRAGRAGGVAVTLYSKEDVPYLKHVANIVAMSQKQQGMESGVDQWLLDALPKLGRNEKQKLKKRGVESRNTRSKQSDPKVARKTHISSKSGYDRRQENKRKGAILGSQGEVDRVLSPDDEDSDFAGFD